MATQSPMRPAWTCPHCGERWYSGREYCGTCHYGMVQDGVGSWVPPQPGLMAPPPAPVPPPVAPPPGEAVSASAPSAEAGQALPLWQQLQVARAEAAQLKEEVSLRQELATRRDRELAEAERQLHAATERAQQWEAWMRQVLGRLAQAVRARGYATEADAQAVDMAVQLVTSGLPGPARGPVAPAGLQPEDVWQAVAQLELRLQALEGRREQGAQPVHSEDTRLPEALAPPSYATWIVTDSMQARLERELLEEQRLRGGPAYGSTVPPLGR